MPCPGSAMLMPLTGGHARRAHPAMDAAGDSACGPMGAPGDSTSGLIAVELESGLLAVHSTSGLMAVDSESGLTAGNSEDGLVAVDSEGGLAAGDSTNELTAGYLTAAAIPHTHRPTGLKKAASVTFIALDGEPRA